MRKTVNSILVSYEPDFADEKMDRVFEEEKDSAYILLKVKKYLVFQKNAVQSCFKFLSRL